MDGCSSKRSKDLDNNSVIEIEIGEELICSNPSRITSVQRSRTTKAGWTNVHEIEGLSACYHDPTKGHIGIYRMLALVKDNYWWKDMGKDVEHYVRNCPVCFMKHDYQKQVGLLQPILITTHQLE